MNPGDVPLHERGYKDYPAQPGGPNVHQHTTVNIRTDPPPKDHIIWSLCLFVYYNFCCLGLVSLIFSIKSRDQKMVGDFEGARRHGLTARNINIGLSILAAVTVGLCIYCVYRRRFIHF